MYRFNENLSRPNQDYCTSNLVKKHMSHGKRFPTMCYVRPDRPQISLRKENDHNFTLKFFA